MGAEQSRTAGEPVASSSPLDNDPLLSPWTVPVDQRRALPTFTAASLASSSALLVSIAGCVYDIGEFADDHPGGREVLDHHRGKDATDAFLEALHPHEVWEQMRGMRVGILVEEAAAAATAPQSAVTGSAQAADEQLRNVPTRRRCLVLYGTQTGTAKSPTSS